MSWIDWLDRIAAVIRDVAIVGGTALLVISLVLAALTGRVCRVVWLIVRGQDEPYFYGIAYRVNHHQDEGGEEGEKLLSIHGAFRRHPQEVVAVAIGGRRKRTCGLHTVTPIKTTWRLELGEHWN